MKTIGENIAYFRKKAGLTQEELSEKMNITSQAITKRENDLSYPDLPNTKMLADILHISADELFSGEEIRPIATDADAEHIARRVLVIRVRTDGEDIPRTNVTVRVPIQALLAAHENGTLEELLGDKAASVKEAIGMIKSGVTGMLVDVQAEGYTSQISVEDYEN